MQTKQELREKANALLEQYAEIEARGGLECREWELDNCWRLANVLADYIHADEMEEKAI